MPDTIICTKQEYDKSLEWAKGQLAMKYIDEFRELFDKRLMEMLDERLKKFRYVDFFEETGKKVNQKEPSLPKISGGQNAASSTGTGGEA